MHLDYVPQIEFINNISQEINIAIRAYHSLNLNGLENMKIDPSPEPTKNHWTLSYTVMAVKKW